MKEVSIAGIGYYIPDRRVTNQELIETYKLDTTDTWIQERLGIVERRYADANQQNSDLAVEACHRALEVAGLKASDIEGIVMSPGFGDRRYPSTAPAVARKLGVKKGFAIDVDVACTGFLSCLQIGRRFVQDGTLGNCLIVGSDIGSRGVKSDPKDRLMGVIFGDAAAAAILTPSSETGIIADYVETDGTQYEISGVLAGGSECPLSVEAIEKGLHFAFMDGPKIWDNAVLRLEQAIRRVCQISQTPIEKIDFFVTHQANLRLIEYLVKTLKVPSSKTYATVQKYGNSGNASMPVTLAECHSKGLIKKGDLVCIAACGAGFSWGSALIRWTC